MADCNCGAATEGNWAGIHTKECASVQSATTGITDIDWLDAKVCELSNENKRLLAALRDAIPALERDWSMTAGGPGKSARLTRLKTARDLVAVT